MAILGNQFRKGKIAAKQLALRNQLWPDIPEDGIWDRKAKVGFTTIPRTLPHIMRIMDSMSNGKPVSSTYFDLWCRMHDEAFVLLASKQQEMAYSSGFAGQRGIQTWAQRIDILDKLGFIKLAPGSAGPRSYALVLNPYYVLRGLKKKKPSLISGDDWNALTARSIEIGADDLLEKSEVKSAV